MAQGDDEIIINDNIGDDIDPFATREISNEQTVQTAPQAASETKPAETKEEVVSTEAVAEPTKPSPAKPKEETVAETKVEAAFANELSEKVFNLLKEGKEDEVFNYLQEKRTLASLDKLPAEQQIKLNLQYQHPDFTQDEIQELFEETYQRPEKPEQAFDQTEEEYAEVLAKYEKQNKKFENKLNREAKEARKVLSQKQSELVLPDIQPKATEYEPSQEDLKRQEELHKSYLQSIDKGLSEFSGFETVLKDGDVTIPIKYTVSDDEKGQLKQDLQSFNVQDFFRERWLNEDNSWNGKQYAEDVTWLKNREKILAKVANEAASQRLAKHIQEQKNIDFSGGRQQSFRPSAENEEDKMVDYFLSVR